MRSAVVLQRPLIAIALACGLVATSLLVFAAAVPAQATATQCSNLQILAHRGYHYGNIAENTIRSFDEAASRGYDIETDVRADSQGQLWIFHDRDVFRATGVHANIDELTTAQVADLRYKKGNYPLPTLQEAIAKWQSYSPDIEIYVEPKTQSIADAVATANEDAGLESRVFYTAYQPFVKNNYPNAKTMARSSNVVPDPQTFVDQGYSEVMFNSDDLTTAQVDAYHAKGLRLQVRTTNVTSGWRPGIASGFDGILTDFPDELTSFCPSALLTPVISSFTPSSGAPGTTVVITGQNFTDASSVKFANTTALFVDDSDTQITVTVPEGVSGDIPISVTNPNGTTSSSALYHIPLSLDSFAPATGQPGDSVVLTGEGLSGADRVRFGQIDASFVIDSGNQITAVVPANAPFSAKLSVRTPSGSVTSAAFYKIPPVIVSFTPASGAAGTAVTISGSSFTGATAVKFGAKFVNSYTVGSDTQISTTVPAGVPAGSQLRVVGPGGTAVSTAVFGQLPPTVTALSPTSGTVGSTVTLSGTNFNGSTAVRFGTVDAASFSVLSNTQLTAVVPSAAPTQSQVTVSNPAGSATSSGSFSVVSPTITSFSPGSGAVGSTVTINGTNLSATTAVRFGAIDAASFSVVSSTQISAVVPSAAPASSQLTVVNPGGSVTSTGSFVVLTPTITAISPGSGGVGSTVTIDGTNFSGATAVRFGSADAASFTVVSGTQITAVVPVSAPAQSQLSVATPNGTATSTSSFTIPAPTITSFTPATGGIGGTVTITGTFLAGVTAVAFGTIPAASFAVVSDTQISAVVPNDVANNSTLKVTTPSGSVDSSAVFVLSKPVVSGFSPGSGPVGSAVVVSGNFFTNATNVRFGTVAATFTINSDSQITVTVPSGALARSKIQVTTKAGNGASTALFVITG